jgi:hypothetical protein
MNKSREDQKLFTQPQISKRRTALRRAGKYPRPLACLASVLFCHFSNAGARVALTEYGNRPAAATACDPRPEQSLPRTRFAHNRHQQVGALRI